jgi:hypothetical protein
MRDFHARLVADAEDHRDASAAQLVQKSVFRTVVAVADDDLALLGELAQGLAFAGVPGGDDGVAGSLAQHGELEVEFGGAVFLVDPERPVHAREGGHQGSVHQFELVGELGKARIAPSCFDFPGHIKKHLPEQLRIEDALPLREAAKAHLPAADILLHPLEMANRAEAAHAVEHRVE